MKERIDISLEHQISLLEKYYDVDKEKKEINVNLYYDKASDLLDYTVGDTGREMFNNDVLEKINEITEKFPIEYKANIIFVINDFEGYSVDVLNEKLTDIIDMNNYQIIKNRKTTWFTAAILATIGFLLLLLLATAKANNFFGDGLKKEVLEEMMDITSWVFIWQAVTVLFLLTPDISKLSFKFIRRVKTVSFSDNKKEILRKTTKEELLANWDSDSKVSSLKKALLLISSTIILAIGFYKAVDIITILVLADGNDKLVGSIITLVFSIFYIIAGLGGINKYLNKKRFNKIVKINSVILGFLIIYALVLYIYYEQYHELVLCIITILVYILFMISIFMPNFRIIKNKENEKKL